MNSRQVPLAAQRLLALAVLCSGCRSLVFQKQAGRLAAHPSCVGYRGPHSPATSLPDRTETWTFAFETFERSSVEQALAIRMLFLSSPLKAAVSCPSILSGAKWIKDQEGLVFAGHSGHNPWPGRGSHTACSTTFWICRIHLFLEPGLTTRSLGPERLCSSIWPGRGLL